MGGRAQQNSATTQTTQLPANQQGNVDTLQQAAGELFKSGGPSYFPGQTYAGPTTEQTQARAGMTGYAQGAGQSFVDQYRGGEQYWLNPNNIFNPDNIPGFRSAQEGVTNQVTQNLQRNILPAIRGNSITGGGLGGSRSAISEGLAIGDTNSALSRTLADMNMNAYNSGLGMYNQAANRAPTTYGMGLAPSATLNDVGTANRGDIQGAIDSNVQRYNFDQLRPLLNAQTLQSLTGTAGQYGGTTTSNTTQGVSGGGSGLMQGIGGLLSLVGMMYGGKGAAGA